MPIKKLDDQNPLTAGREVLVDYGQDEAMNRRINLERGHSDERVFGGGTTFFHPENSVLSEALLRGLLKITGMLDRGRRNAMDIVVRENPVVLPRLPQSFDGFTVLQISDLHLDSRPDFAPRLAEVVAPLEYDLCVLTGDYRFHTKGDVRPSLMGLSLLREALKGDAYAVLGNHDSAEMIPDMLAMGYELLYNASVPIRRDDQDIYLVGVDDPHFFQTDDLEKALIAVPRGITRILLAHSPEIYRVAESADVDFLVCGHTHGGQIALPGGKALYKNARCPSRLASGNWQYRSLKGYTSVGAGSSLLDVRFNCQPEVVLHRLHCP
ncbi:MAG: metallophosphoesterase [Chromatiales bacterium]|nr:metallophosphoesterase [Chromatiales bacterium]